MNPWLFISLWVIAQALQLILWFFGWRQRPDFHRPRRVTTLNVSGMACLVPFVTLLLFLLVFVVGGSSNVAQIAGEGGRSLWSLWFRMWPLLYMGNPVAFVVCLIAMLLPPYPPGYWYSIGSRACGVIASAFAWYVVVQCFPDA